MSSQVLDKSGLTYLWSKIKVLLAAKQNTLPTGTAGQVLTYRNSAWGAETPAEGLPSPPQTNGTYLLQCVKSSGSVQYSWVELDNYNTEEF